jgi:hypothetical protein
MVINFDQPGINFMANKFGKRFTGLLSDLLITAFSFWWLNSVVKSLGSLGFQVERKYMKNNNLSGFSFSSGVDLAL